MLAVLPEELDSRGISIDPRRRATLKTALAGQVVLVGEVLVHAAEQASAAGDSASLAVAWTAWAAWLGARRCASFLCTRFESWCWVLERTTPAHLARCRSSWPQRTCIQAHRHAHTPAPAHPHPHTYDSLPIMAAHHRRRGWCRPRQRRRPRSSSRASVSCLIHPSTRAAQTGRAQPAA